MIHDGRNMSHDKNIYPDPMNFNPDRFLGSNPNPDPMDMAFGFGRYVVSPYLQQIHILVRDNRRSCPGIHFADASIYIGCAMSLAVFDVSKSVDPASGEVITPVYTPLPGTLRYHYAYYYIDRELPLNFTQSSKTFQMQYQAEEREGCFLDSAVRLTEASQ